MSSILEDIETQIAGLKTTTSKSNVGVVRECGDGVARIEGLSEVMLNEMIEFPNGVFGLALNLEETEVGAILLAEAEQRYAEILAKGNAQAQKMIDEARESAAHVAERKQQEAVAAAEQIMAKAREASAIEHERTMEALKRELGRLVVETTAKVTGKVLTSDDQKRLQEEAARQLAS